MIITNNEEALRVICEQVKEDEISSLISSLESELRMSEALGRPGIGLAAPQIGVAKQFAIARVNGQNFVNLVNAKIVKSFDKVLFRQEGCLSFPGRVEDTMRYQEIVVENGIYPNRFIARGLLAVVIQHELDHLNQILLSDVAIKQKVVYKLGPNDPCGCGSTKKYKKCCK